jgi:hypothetical protein
MDSLLLSLLVIAASPFAPNATISIDNASPQPLVVPAGPAVAGVLAGGGGAGAGLASCQPRVLVDCEEGLCPVPPEGSIPDWTSLFLVDYGLQVDNRWKQYTFNGAPATLNDVLRHVRDTFSTVHAIYKRDAGVILRIKHIRVMNTIAMPADDDLADRQSWSFWKSNLPAVDFYFRAVPNSPDGAGAGTPNVCTEDVYGGAFAPYSFSPINAANNEWRGLVRDVAHEMAHVFAGGHTDCYQPRIENCPSSCYSGPLMCPANNVMSLNGDCSYLCDVQNLPLPRFGPPLGPMNRVVRNNLLAFNALYPGCLQDAGQFTGSRLVDSDTDEYPDGLDNCPTVFNNEQVDSDADGLGDACDPCPNNPIAACVGDCNCDRSVYISELITGVNIVLGASPVSSCFAMDPGNDGSVTIAEVIQAVINSLQGCPALPRPTATPAALSAQFLISSITGKPGDTKTFGVAVVNANGFTPSCAGLQLDLNFPANVLSQPACVINSSALPNFTLDTSMISGGRLRTFIHSTQMGDLNTFTVVSTGVVLYTCTTQVLSNAPLGTYALSGTLNVMSDPTGNAVTTSVSPGTITINTSGGSCAITGPADSGAGVWALLVPLAVLLTARRKNTCRFVCVALSAILGVLIFSTAAWSQDGGTDVEGELTIIQPGTCESVPTACEAAAASANSALQSSVVDPEVQRAAPRWLAFNVQRSGTEVTGQVMVVGSSAFGVGTFTGGIVSSDGSLTGEVSDVEGNLIAVITGQLTANGLIAEMQASNEERAVVSFAAPLSSSWSDRAVEALQAFSNNLYGNTSE